jgi:hypothetical protein
VHIGQLVIFVLKIATIECCSTEEALFRACGLLVVWLVEDSSIEHVYCNILNLVMQGCNIRLLYHRKVHTHLCAANSIYNQNFMKLGGRVFICWLMVTRLSRIISICYTL